MQSLDWLCTKASRNLFWEPSPEPFPEPCWLRNLLRSLLLNPVESDMALHQSLPDFTCLCTKASLLRNLLRNPAEPDFVLHQGFLEASPEPFAEPCWTCPGSAPKPLATFSGAFAGTFSGTLLNRNPPHPTPGSTCMCDSVCVPLGLQVPGNVNIPPHPSPPPHLWFNVYVC